MKAEKFTAEIEQTQVFLFPGFYLFGKKLFSVTTTGEYLVKKYYKPNIFGAMKLKDVILIDRSNGKKIQ